MKTERIKILRAGTFKDRHGTIVNIDENLMKTIVKNYNNQPPTEKHTAPLRPISHDNRGNFAAGFVDSLEFADGEVYANILPTPELRFAVKNNYLKTVSAGLNKTRDNLDHIAILGSLTPAIKGLELLEFSEDYLLEFSDNEINNLSNFNEAQMPPYLIALRDQMLAKVNVELGTEQGTKINAIFEEIAKQLAPTFPPAQAPAQPQGQPQGQPAPAFAQNPAFVQFSESEEGKAFLQKQKETELEIAKLKRENKKLEFSTFTKENLTKLTSANAAKATELMLVLSDTEKTEFSADGKELSGVELFKSFVKDLPEVVKTGSEVQFSDEEQKEVSSGIGNIVEKFNSKN